MLVFLDDDRLMLREPKSIYVGKRSGILLKVKTFFDADAKVIGYEPGKVSPSFLPTILTPLFCNY